MCDKDLTFTGFGKDAAKKSLHISRILSIFINRVVADLRFRTSTPKGLRTRMDIPFLEKFKYEQSFHMTMDHDSGYISHNQESNLDSSVENSTEITTKPMSRPIYLSEDALLEKPDNIKPGRLSIEIEKQDYEEVRNIFYSPDVVIPSSVVSQATNYSGFENDSDSSSSMEIPTSEQIIVKTIDLEQRQLSTSNSDSEDHNRFDQCGEDVASLPCLYQKNEPNESALNNITNIDTLTPNDTEKKRKLTLIISKCNKENAYTVKRKFRSITPDKSVTVDKLDVELVNNLFSKEANTLQEHPSVEDTCKSVVRLQEENSNYTENISEGYCTLNTENTIVKEDEEITEISYIVVSPKSEKPVEHGPENLNQKKVNISVEESCKNVDGFQEENGNYTTHISEGYCTLNTVAKKDDEMPEVRYVVVSPKNEKAVEPKYLNPKILNATPETKYENTVNPDISPDLFLEEETGQKLDNNAINRIYITEEKYIINKDRRILKRVQGALKGILPPLSVTVVQMSIKEMLNRLESNKDYFWTSGCSDKSIDVNKNDSLNTSNESSFNGEFRSLLITGSLEHCVNSTWPQIMTHRHHGLHYNRSKLSEEFEELCAKYAQRYVGAETQSACTVFETKCTSPMKRKQLKQRWPVKSPGRRLSHLARRRITFSSSNLQAGTSSVASSRARQILIDARKLDLLRRRSPRKSPRKTPRKSPRVKSRTPSSSAKKKLAMHFRKVSGEIEKTGISSNSLVLSSKRKLFQSPDRDKNCSLFLPSTSGMSTFDNDLKNPATKRALFLSPSKSSPIKRSPFKRSPFKRLEAGDKKRKRDDSEDMHPSKMSKIANIRPSETETKGTFDRTASDLNLSLNKSVSSQSGELSVEHKKKLYWAVYEALRSQNITHTHPQFKVYASVLARVTRRFLLNLSNNASRAEGGTSERMSRIARHHVYAVVKGKTVDEIINEYMRNRLRNVKPRGYIGIEEFRERNRELANDKENAIQGRVNATASLEKKKLEQLGSENKIERIRKVINFEDNR